MVRHLLDNATLLENIYRRKEEEGLDSEQGAHVGAAEVTSAVVASTTTNLAAVAPFLLMTGLSAMSFKELILTISFAIRASLPLALTLVPMLAAQLGKIRFKSGRISGGAARLRAVPRPAWRRYRRVANAAVRTLHGCWVARWRCAGRDLGVCRTSKARYLPPVDDGTIGSGSVTSETAPLRRTGLALELEERCGACAHESVFATAGGGGGWGGGGSGNLDVRWCRSPSATG